jgi:hypothetical protein
VGRDDVGGDEGRAEAGGGEQGDGGGPFGADGGLGLEAGNGQQIHFNATDIQHAGTDKIVEDWHIEDNETLLSQLGVTG